MANNFFIKGKFKEHFKENSGFYIFSIIILLIGVVAGLYFVLVGYKYSSLLTTADKTMLDYITGNASYTEIFYSRLLDIAICLIIVFILNLSSYTSFLSCIFIGYQTSLLVVSCGAIISLYGISGILNVLIFMLPTNLVNLVLLVIANVLAHSRAKKQRLYNIKFLSSFNNEKFLLNYLLCFLIALILCLINSFVIPLFVRSFIVINY